MFPKQEQPFGLLSAAGTNEFANSGAHRETLLASLGL
jgi:hypothetical protein